MILHLGDDVAVNEKHIIAVLNISGKSKINNEFLTKAGEKVAGTDNTDIIKISTDPVKTIIMVKNNDKLRIYLSPISSATLLKRSEIKNMTELSKETKTD